MRPRCCLRCLTRFGESIRHLPPRGPPPRPPCRHPGRATATGAAAPTATPAATAATTASAPVAAATAATWLGLLRGLHLRQVLRRSRTGMISPLLIQTFTPMRPKVVLASKKP